MYKKSILQPILFGFLTIFLIASCDKDFNELGTDIVGDDHYGFLENNTVTIKAFNQKLGAVASNDLPINPLGFYTNPAFGRTQANFVTQLEMVSVNPKFNNTDNELFQDPPTIDSVIMEVPYFKTILKTERIDNVLHTTYNLDSIYGPNNVTTGIAESQFKLEVFHNKYFLRSLDPNLSLSESQAFYTDEDMTFDINKGVQLNDAPQADIPAEGIYNADGHENNFFFFDKREHKTKVLNNDGVDTKPRTVPSMRLHLNKAFFNDKILNAPAGQLLNNDVLKNHLRGLYFKVTGTADGNMAMINFKGGKITMYYKEDLKKTETVRNPDGTTTNVVTYTRPSKTFALNLGGKSVSLLKNSQENIDYVNAVATTDEASKLYLKGGEGAISIIDLFGSTDNYRYVLRKDGSGNPIDENDKLIPLNANGNPKTGFFLTYARVNTPNGVSDELDELKYPAIDPDVPTGYHSTKNRWMINEASLTFYIDNQKNSPTNSIMPMDDPSAFEPNRIFLYDLTHKKVLLDYTYDFTTNGLYPKFNKGVFGGILVDENGKLQNQREEGTGIYKYKGAKYKVRITNYVRNLIKNDSTNVRLGLAVTENINSVGFSKLKTPNSNTTVAPTMSVMNPLGTILYGTHPSVPADKRLKLQIYYTKPN